MKSTTLHTLFIALIVSLGGFLMGFDAGVVAGANPFYKLYFNLNEWALGWSVGCLTFGAMIGNGLAGTLADRFGRRYTLMVAAFLYTLSAAGSALATDFSFFILSRMLGGVAVGLALLIAPIYIAEIAPARLRGRFVSCNQLNIVIGFSAVFFANYYIFKAADSEISTWINRDNCWRWMLGAELLPAVLYFILLFFVPRSPRWLIMQGRDAEASQVLSRILGRVEASTVFEEIKSHLIQSSSTSGVHWKQLFHPAFRGVLIIGLGLAFFQQITGINAIFFYAPTIFEKTGISQESAFMQTVIIGLVNLGFTFAAIYIIDRFGRRPLLLIGTAIMSASLLLNAWAFHNASYQIDEELYAASALETQQMITPILSDSFASEEAFREGIQAQGVTDNIDQWIQKGLVIQAELVLVAIIGFIAAFALSLGPVMWALFSEIFPNSIRGLAISFAGFFNSLVSYGVQQVFPWQLKTLGPSLTFLIFGLFALLAFFFTLRFIPETKGKSLEELESLLIRS